MSTFQHELNDFLQSELYHTLGSYGTTAHRLGELGERIAHGTRRAADQPFDSLLPANVVTHMRHYNESLRTSLHRAVDLGDPEEAVASDGARHPLPPRFGGTDARNRWVLDFYRTVILALEEYGSSDSRKKGKPTALPPLARLGYMLAVVHDPQRRGTNENPSDELVRGRIERNSARLELAEEIIGADPGRNHPEEGAGGAGHERERTADILADYLGSADRDQLHTHVIGALVEAHMCMHHAEHLMSKSFGLKIENQRALDGAAERELRRSLMLNTFAYVVGRSVPWIFAEDEDERAFVVERYRECCERVTPPYCLWIGNQLSLLALHRRAFTYYLMGQPDKAYNDFHKLTRFIQNLKRQLDRSTVSVPGSDVFLTGLESFAAHHTGRIYRGQHAHAVALSYFERASAHLEALEANADTHEMLQNSRWRIDLRVSQAKAYYELGLIKSCLLCYARAWHAFLQLADTESQARANYAVVDGVIEWLSSVEADPDLDKVEVLRQFEPLVEQFQMIRDPVHLRALAADIMLRIGHVLFTLRLPLMEGEEIVRSPESEEGKRYPEVDHRLAHRCLLQAARLDRASTLIAADLRRFRYWQDRLDVDDETGGPPAAPTPAPVSQQWAGGSGDFEEAAGVVEYVLQSWLSDTYQPPKKARGAGSDKAATVALARRLLVAFLAHTDSSNVKLAQIYRHLMRESSQEPYGSQRHGAPKGSADGDSEAAGPSVEFVCLRRYSSFFPFLPRPSAFPVLGGGYFVRVKVPTSLQEGGPEKRRDEPFGIAIDPGPDFVDNLYRCGYCLGDVHMIVVTHDHADHIASLDGLLGLLGYRAMYGADTFDDKQKLAIVGNESVKARYGFYNESKRYPVGVWTFEEWESGTPSDLNAYDCPGLRIERVQTTEHVDAAGAIAQGFLLSVTDEGKSASILFTSDMGKPPSLSAGDAAPEGAVCWVSMSMRHALERADVVVAHISSAQLSELRRLSGLDEAPAPAGPRRAPDTPPRLTAEFEGLWQSLLRQVHEAEDAEDERWARRRRFLMKQLQFGFHSPPTKAIEGEPSHKGLDVSPLSPTSRIRESSEKHLYVSGILPIARRMKELTARRRVLVVGELREELGTFRTRIAHALNVDVLRGSETTALTADIGLKLRIEPGETTVLCSTCDLDNDLVDCERFHRPHSIAEVCVKGEDEGVFYNCSIHEPLVQPHPVWIERVERYDPFGR